jgi:hypothetical protein
LWCESVRTLSAENACALQRAAVAVGQIEPRAGAGYQHARLRAKAMQPLPAALPLGGSLPASCTRRRRCASSGPKASWRAWRDWRSPTAGHRLAHKSLFPSVDRGSALVA